MIILKFHDAIDGSDAGVLTMLDYLGRSYIVSEKVFYNMNWLTLASK